MGDRDRVTVLLKHQLDCIANRDVVVDDENARHGSPLAS